MTPSSQTAGSPGNPGRFTTESLEEMDLKVGDQVSLIVKAVNVLPVKE